MILSKMRDAGRKIASIMEDLSKEIDHFNDCEEIDQYCAQKIKNLGGVSGALNYQNSFKKNVCVSPNNVVCHGMVNYPISNISIISVDIVASFDGYFGDSCVTFIKGNVEQRRKKLVEVAYESMWSTIEMCRPGICTGDLGYQMNAKAEEFGFFTVREFAGHGIDRVMHKDPMIPFYGEKNKGFRIQPNSFITIEPMLNEHSRNIRILDDGWTAITQKGWSAQFEHTIFVGESAIEVMTYNYFDKKNNKPPIIKY